MSDPIANPIDRPIARGGPAPKMTLVQAGEALEWNRAGGSQRKLAAEYGVSRSVLGDWL